MRVSFECGASGEGKRVSVTSIRKAAVDKCKKDMNVMKGKLRKECEGKMKGKGREMEVMKADKEACEERMREIEKEVQEMRREMEERRGAMSKQDELVNRIKDNVNKVENEFEGLKQLIGKLTKVCEGDIEVENYAASYDDDEPVKEVEEEDEEDDVEYVIH